MTVFHDPQDEIEKLRAVITDALKALDDGRIGDVRRILKTGKAEPVKAVSGVIARDGAA